MENNLIKIFKDTVISNHDNGNTINSLIKLNIINIDDLTEEIIDTYNPEYIYNFAKYIDNNYIDLLAEALSSARNPEYIYLFAKDIKDAPIEILQEAIIKTRNSKYLYLFAKDIEKSDPSHIAYFLPRCEDSSEYVYLFAKHFKDIRFREFAFNIINSGSSETIYKYAKNIDGAPIDELANAIIEHNEKNTYTCLQKM